MESKHLGLCQKSLFVVPNHLNEQWAADFYKNMFLYAKMRNVAGLSQTDERRPSDLFAKCRYLDGLTESTLPIALTRFLKDYPQIDTLALHLDNDKAGRLAAKIINIILQSDYTVSDEPSKYGKDVNDYLKRVVKINKSKER
jgi:hypothetical protein